MLKKRIILIGFLLALSIVGQVLLRPCMGGNETGLAAESPAAAESTEPQQENVPLLNELNKDTDALQSDLLRTFLYMLGFVALIGTGAWAVCRKFSCRLSGTGGQHIRVGETVRMGPRKALHLIRVGQKTFLVGSTSDSFCLLGDVSDSVAALEVKSHE